MRLLFGALLLLGHSVFAQPGSPDPNFNAEDIGVTASSEIFGGVGDIEPLADGSFYVTSGSNLPLLATDNYIYRIFQNGQIDESFNTGGGFNVNVMCLEALSDGKLMAGGGFTQINGVVCMGLAKFNEDGSLDNTFNVGSGFNGWPLVICEQPDGKILVGGNFTTYQGIPASRLIRLNPDGTKDLSFNTATGPDGNVTEILVQPDGKIVIGGSWNSYNGNNTRKSLARLHPNGSYDSSFAISSLNFGTVTDIEYYPDGRILVSVGVSNYLGQPAKHLLRFLSNGQLDPTFYLLDGAENGANSICKDDQGNIYIAGEEYGYQNTSYTRIIKLDSLGHEDLSFQKGPGFSSIQDFFDMVMSVDNSGILVPCSGVYNGEPVNALMKIYESGDINYSFAPNYGPSQFIRSFMENDDSTLWVGGNFEEYFETNLSGVARIYLTGELDSLQTINDTLLSVGNMKKDQLGRIICMGSLEHPTQGWKSMFRLLPNGLLDNTLNTGLDFNSSVNDMVFVAGDYVVVGAFTTYNGITRNRMARLKPDGALVAGFGEGNGFNSFVKNIFILPDSTIFVSGNFTTFNGNGRNRIAKLNLDGTLVSSFNPGAGPNTAPQDVAIQSDGRILLVGSFDTYQGQLANGIVRILPDGTRDNSFNVGSGFDDLVLCVELQSDGKILCGGRFKEYNGVPCNSLIRLLPNGAPDPLFITGEGALLGPNTEGQVHAIEVLNDGRIVIGGKFYVYNGKRCNHLTMILGGDVFAGCTDPSACNYNANASQMDGSCLYFGCTDISACNYDASAGCDNNSCEYLSCSDSDSDGLSDLFEINNGSSPFNADSDSDGLTDYDEIITLQTNPNTSDTDSDGLTDHLEITHTTYSPLLYDTDGDGCNDAFEFQGTCENEPDPCPTDLNGDGYVNSTDLLIFISGYGSECGQ